MEKSDAETLLKNDVKESSKDQSSKRTKNCYHCFDNPNFMDDLGKFERSGRKLPDVEVTEKRCDNFSIEDKEVKTESLDQEIKYLINDEDDLEEMEINELVLNQKELADDVNTENFHVNTDIFQKENLVEEIEDHQSEEDLVLTEHEDLKADEEVRQIEELLDDESEKTSVIPPPKSHSARLENDSEATIKRRMGHLVRAFSDRAMKIKKRIAQPITPPSTPSIDGDEERRSATPDKDVEEEDQEENEKRSWKFPRFPDTLDPQSKLYVSWLLLVTLAYLYNAWAIFLRASFYYQTPATLPYFLLADYISDAIYIIDIVVFKVRVKFIYSGFWVENRQEIKLHYLKKFKFKMDLLSLLPLDILYIWLGVKPMLRLSRLLKIQTFWEFFDRLDSIATSPHAVRIFRTVLYMLYLIHLNSCLYFVFSDWEGIGSNQWVFSGVGNAYIRCFYFATKTATSIGKNPKPVNENEYLYMTFSWLLGVFVFALLIGQVRDIVATANQAHRDYQDTVDKTIQYMQRLNIPADLQAKVRLWFDHNWEQQKMLDERETLEVLPLKLKTDMALSVNFKTLNKVQLFKDCEKALLRDLVLKLRPVLFLPGDYICKKGEVGKEMYIVNYGTINVLGHERKVLATLSESSVFGEISLLALSGGNRRTADVCSHGFSNLFVLSKEDLQEAIKDYPLAQKALKKKAQKLIKENEAREKEPDPEISPVICSSVRPKTPKIVKTVIEVMDRSSKYRNLISRLTNKSSPTPRPISHLTASSVSIRDNCVSSMSVESAAEEQLRNTDISSIFDPTQTNDMNSDPTLASIVPLSPRYLQPPSTDSIIENLNSSCFEVEDESMEKSCDKIQKNIAKNSSATCLKKNNKISPSPHSS